MMNRSVLDRQMFRYGGSVPMQDGGIASLPQEIPMQAPMEPSPEMMEEMEMRQLQGAAMEQGVEPDVLEDTLAQHAESFARMDEAEDYETVINEIRGDELPISARYEELAGMVGPEDAQATPESVLTLVQPVIQLASIDQGIGGLAAEEMMDVPVEGPMAEGIMSTIDMQGAEQEAVPPVNFNQGGAVPPVQYFNQGGVGAIPKIDFRTIPGMQDYSRAAGQMGAYDFSGKRVGKTIPEKDMSEIEAQIKKDASMDKVAPPSKLEPLDTPSQRTSAPSGNALEEPRTTAPSEFSYETLLDPEAEQAAIDRQKNLNKSQLLFAMSKGFGNIASGRGSLATRLSQGLDHVFGAMSNQASSLKALKDSQEAARAKLKKEELDAKRRFNERKQVEELIFGRQVALEKMKIKAAKEKLKEEHKNKMARQKQIHGFKQIINNDRFIQALAKNVQESDLTIKEKQMLHKQFLERQAKGIELGLEAKMIYQKYNNQFKKGLLDEKAKNDFKKIALKHANNMEMFDEKAKHDIEKLLKNNEFKEAFELIKHTNKNNHAKYKDLLKKGKMVLGDGSDFNSPIGYTSKGKVDLSGVLMGNRDLSILKLGVNAADDQFKITTKISAVADYAATLVGQQFKDSKETQQKREDLNLEQTDVDKAKEFGQKLQYFGTQELAPFLIQLRDLGRTSGLGKSNEKAVNFFQNMLNPGVTVNKRTIVNNLNNALSTLVRNHNSLIAALNEGPTANKRSEIKAELVQSKELIRKLHDFGVLFGNKNQDTLRDFDEVTSSGGSDPVTKKLQNKGVLSTNSVRKKNNSGISPQYRSQIEAQKIKNPSEVTNDSGMEAGY